MDRIRGERFAAPYLQVERSDEIGQLSHSFYTMLGRIQELLATVRENEERKKEMELTLLLHQIRPHFLYNTLACIGSLAKQHRVQEVEETIRSLIGLLSYSIGRSDLVTLEAELRALREYMQIQNVKYANAFQFNEQIDPALMRIPLQKLILQPLVENAIFHGLAEKGTGSVLVRVHVEEGRLLLTVRDDGNGMTQEQIAAGITRPSSSSSEVPLGLAGAGGRFNGIGLSNVQERIRLHYGPDYGLEIRSEPGAWTEVTIVLPLP
jgi:two-component system sensor histidine kinase YesM